MAMERVSLSLPVDVKAVLDEQPNASAYVAESIRLRRGRERLLQVMSRHGYLVTDEGMSRMGQRLRDKQAQIAAAVAGEQLGAA